MTDPNEDIILKYLRDELSPDELITFNTWLNHSPDNQVKIDDYRHIWLITDRHEIKKDFQSDDEWEKLLVTLGDRKTKVVPMRMRTVPVYYRAAAVLIGLAILSYFLFPAILSKPVKFSTANSTKHFVLPDGSNVWMNENSEISYESDFSDDRHLHLLGEAFFEVKRNPHKPFVIQSDGTAIKVLGTSFNVRAYPKETKTNVYVVTGKVSFLKNNERDGLVLTPGMSGNFDKSTLKLVSQIEGEPNILAWKNKKLVFKKTPLREVINVLRTYFKVDIQLKNSGLSVCRFTSTFNNPTLPEVIEAISLSLNLNVDHQSTYYLLDGEGCTPN